MLCTGTEQDVGDSFNTLSSLTSSPLCYDSIHSPLWPHHCACVYGCVGHRGEYWIHLPTLLWHVLIPSDVFPFSWGYLGAHGAFEARFQAVAVRFLFLLVRTHSFLKNRRLDAPASLRPWTYCVDPPIFQKWAFLHVKRGMIQNRTRARKQSLKRLRIPPKQITAPKSSGGNGLRVARGGCGISRQDDLSIFRQDDLSISQQDDLSFTATWLEYL